MLHQHSCILAEDLMQLRLEVQSYTGKQPPSPSAHNEHYFTEAGGSIGRGQGNTWTLEHDMHLSRRHVIIEYRNNAYCIIDVSSNGAFINQSASPLGRNNSHILNDGDTIQLGEHKIIARIIDTSMSKHKEFYETAPQQDASSIFSNSSYLNKFTNSTLGINNNFEDNNLNDDPFGDVFNPRPIHSNHIPKQENETFNSIYDAFQLLPAQSSEAHAVNISDSTSQQIESLETNKIIEAPRPTSITEEFTFTHKNNQEESILFSAGENEVKTTAIKQENIPSPLSPPINKTKENEEASITPESLEDLLAGAGLTFDQLKKDVPTDIYNIIGRILQESIQGTIELLRGRSEIKNHLKLDRTVIGDIQNNPLKFMPNAEQVMIYLFTSGNNTDKSYLSLLDAMQEAFDDLKAHQLAVTAAMQQALQATVRHHFSPDNLKKKLEKTNKIASLIPLQREAKLWNMFENLYDDIEHEASENFQAILDREVAKAYELQIMEIKYQRNINRKKKNF